MFGTHTFQKVQTFLFHQSTEYLSKSCGDNQDIFLTNVRRVLLDVLFFFVSSDFCLETLPWMPFLPSLFLIVESRTLSLTEASAVL